MNYYYKKQFKTINKHFYLINDFERIDTLMI